MQVYFMDGPLRTSIEVQLYHTRMDREWEEQFMHQALEEAQLENSKLGNFAARKRCYQFRWQEICIRHLLKVYTLYRGDCAIKHGEVKSVNLKYNMLVLWADGTNNSSTKRLTFQAFFFHNFL